MKKMVYFYFGVRAAQNLPGYNSGRSGSFKFELPTNNKKMETIKQAMGLFYRFKGYFLKKLMEEMVSCQWQVIPDRTKWIPTCYLKRPERIEIVTVL